MQAQLAARAASSNDPAAAPLPAPSSSTSYPPTDRPRPATSAGEYHFTVPAPFMTPLGTPVSIYAPQQLHLPPPPPFLESGPSHSTWGSGSFPLPPCSHQQQQQQQPQPHHHLLFASSDHQQAYSSAANSTSSPHRPVTAPNHYAQVPAFGFPQAVNGGARYGTAAGVVGMGARRLSLPSELKQPTPIFGFGAPGGEAGFGSIQEEGEHGGLGAVGVHEEAASGSDGSQ
jgi:hypothetical protein